MASGFGDLDAYMQQQGSPNVYNKLVGKRIEFLRKYFDEDVEVLSVWEKVEVIVIPVMKEKKQHQKINGQQKKGNIIEMGNHWEIVMW